MHISDLKSIKMNEALAYTLGLIFPLYKQIILKDKEYIVGSINHNYGKISQDELNEHFKKVNSLLSNYMGTSGPEIKTNKTPQYKISSKLGFSILVENTGTEEIICKNILKSKVQEIVNSSDSIKKEFIKGCFDGRSSWDTTAHYLSIDVDRDYDKQDLIENIIKSVEIDINVNRRDINHKKNDQIRIKQNSLKVFYNKIGLYSTYRMNLIKNAMNL